jgi:glutathione S-transferase
MIDLHYWTTPNGHKIAMFLEETGVPFRCGSARASSSNRAS